jgi:hypothetical protein
MDIEAGHIWPGMLISGQESRGRVVDVAEVAKNIGGSILRNRCCNHQRVELTMTRLKFKSKPVGWKSQFTPESVREVLQSERKWSHNAANLRTARD